MVALPNEILFEMLFYILPKSLFFNLSNSKSKHFSKVQIKDYLVISQVCSRFRYAVFFYAPITPWLCSMYLHISRLESSMVFFNDPIRVRSITTYQLSTLSVYANQSYVASIIAEMIRLLSSSLKTISIRVNRTVLRQRPLFDSVLLCSNLEELELFGSEVTEVNDDMPLLSRSGFRELILATPHLTYLTIEQREIRSFSHKDLLLVLPAFKHLKRVKILQKYEIRHQEDTIVGNILLQYQKIVD